MLATLVPGVPLAEADAAGVAGAVVVRVSQNIHGAAAQIKRAGTVVLAPDTEPAIVYDRAAIDGEGAGGGGLAPLPISTPQRKLARPLLMTNVPVALAALPMLAAS